jgi:hypothetical protein
MEGMYHSELLIVSLEYKLATAVATPAAVLLIRSRRAPLCIHDSTRDAYR